MPLTESYLLTEDGDYWLTEDGFYVIIDEYDYHVSTVSGTEDVHGNFYYTSSDVSLDNVVNLTEDVTVDSDGITTIGGAINVKNSSGTTVIDSGGLAADSVTATQIAAGAVTAAKIAAGTITANELAADSVTATQIAAGAVNTSELNASAVIALVTNSGATVVIDAAGITVTGGEISVTNAAATVIIDGTSNMFKIGATGTLSVTASAWTSGNYTVADSSATLTGMGVLSLPPLQLSLINYSVRVLGSYQIPYLGAQYVASSSGGSPTTRIIGASTHFFVYAGLDGSNYGVVTLTARNFNSSTADASARYYALLEASI